MHLGHVAIQLGDWVELTSEIVLRGELPGQPPECPKPPLPLAVGGSSATSSHVTRTTGAMTSCAIRMPRDTVNGIGPKLINGTRSSPR
jgi:hypothetical protein